MKAGDPLVTTIGERCRVCYTCVRDCPAKAIRIMQGQAQVLPERCIGCGNCVRVCSQKAKQVYDSLGEVRTLLADDSRPVAAILAPSFAAEFTDLEPGQLVAMLHRLGFDVVAEVSFGADLVAREYSRLMERQDGRRYIATTCPAVVAFIEKYHPSLIPNLAPIASPMVAESRALRRLHGDRLRIVFIGPCLAKKVEASERLESEAPEVDAVLTFIELRKYFAERHVFPKKGETRDFDPPHPGLGALFPISRGMLQAARMVEDLLSGDVVAADGRNNFVQALREFETGALDARLLEILCCNGCIMGSGMSAETPRFRRRAAVSQYARARIDKTPPAVHEASMTTFDGLDLSVHFASKDLDITAPSEEEVLEVMRRMGKDAPEDELNCGACGYSTCRDHAAAICKGLAESEMCLPYTIDRLRRSLGDLQLSNEELASTREALHNAEKLASMGQLSAGIAHEVNNPLGVILLYANLLLKECAVDSPLQEDLAMIAEQAERCKKIVTGLLNFARRNKVVRQPANVRELIDRCLMALIVPASVKIRIVHELSDPMAEIDRDQIVQVLTNLLVNAMEAMPAGGSITVTTFNDDRNLKIVVADTGEGIKPENLTKIFEPFFTTKQIGKGTGLGLAVTYGIIKMHRGQIDVRSNTDPAKGPVGTTFTVTLPRKVEEENGQAESIGGG